MRGALAAAALPMLLSLGARAAPSFDCAKASAPTEKAICASDALSAMDRKLAATYQAVLPRLSPAAQARVREGQRQWLRYIATVCNTADYQGLTGAKASTACLTDKYPQRQTQLEKTVQTRGGRTFFLVTIFKARRNPVPDTQFSQVELSYLQMDGAAADKALNARLAAFAVQPGKDVVPDEGRDSWSQTDLLPAPPALLSFTTIDSNYEHHAAHPMSVFTNFHWLVREGRALSEQDVFAAQAGWKQVLRQDCFNAVKHYGFIKSVKEMRGLVEKPDRWTFKKEGLSVAFQQYEVASYADGMPQVVIPWSRLKPFLARTAPALLGL